jgi:Leucine-rich repeat (LRR) protein
MIPQLVSLDLSNCGIKYIAPKAFQELDQLQKLLLQKNKLQELRQRTVETIEGEQRLKFDNFAKLFL